MGIVKIINPDKKDTTKSKLRKVVAPQEEFFEDYSYLIDDPKKLNNFVKKIKSMIRTSLEYKKLMRFLKERKGLDKCGYHHNISYPDFSIEIHHYPLTITDIIYTIFYKQCANNEIVTASSVQEEVMKIHYLDIVGLYPFCDTCHEFNHSDVSNNFIPNDDLYGFPEAFVEIYGEYMSEKLMVKYNYWKELNKGYNILNDYVPEELKKCYLYLEDTEDGSLNAISTKKLKDMIDDFQRN